MPRELDRFVVLELQSRLEPLANSMQSLSALLNGSSPGLVGFAHGSSPKTDTIESTSDVDDDTHHLVVIFVLQVLSDSCEHDMEPERIDVDRLLVLELERPFATVLVLRIFPLGANTLLEEMIVGLERKIGCGRDIVLYMVS